MTTEPTKSGVTVGRLLDDYTDAKNRHDVEGVLALCADDCVYESVGIPGVARGKDALRAFYTALFTALPDYRGAFDGQAVADDTAVTWGRFSGTMLGEYLGFKATGRSIEVPVAFVCVFRDGLLASDTGYFDAMTFWHQTGVDPASLGGSPMARATNEDEDGLDHRGRFWIDRYRTAWAERNMESLLAPLRPDCFVFYPPMGEPTNRAGLRAFFDYAYSLLPDFTIEPLSWAQCGDDILIEWRGTATVEEETFEWGGADRFRFDQEGRIVNARAYWDPRGLVGKLGAAAAAGAANAADSGATGSA